MLQQMLTLLTYPPSLPQGGLPITDVAPAASLLQETAILSFQEEASHTCARPCTASSADCPDPTRVPDSNYRNGSAVSSEAASAAAADPERNADNAGSTAESVLAAAVAAYKQEKKQLWKVCHPALSLEPKCLCGASNNQLTAPILWLASTMVPHRWCSGSYAISSDGGAG